MSVSWRSPLFWLYHRWLGVLQIPTVGVRAMVVDHAARVLLVRHTYRPLWYTPGGGVDRGETPAEALARELREEVGLTLTAPPELWAVFHHRLHGHDDYPILYVVRSFEEGPSHSPEIAEKRWFSLDALPDDMHPPTHARLEEWRDGRRPPAHWRQVTRESPLKQMDSADSRRQ